MNPAVTIQEYESATLRLNHADVAALQTAAGSALQFTPGLSPGSWTVRASGSVGTIVAGNHRILIRPKANAANLFYMLEADGNALDIDEAVFDYDTSGDLLAAFATFFGRALERTLAQGIPRTYVNVADNLTAIRGRVDLRRQLSGGGLPLPVACEYDELSIDSQLLRIVASATGRLVRLPGVSVKTRQGLRRSLAAFDGVGPLTDADLRRPTPFTRLDNHFVVIERLARIVHERSSVTDRVGQTAAGTFLVNMAVLFERFLEHRVRAELKGRLTVHGQFLTNLDTDGSVAICPDLVFTDGDQPVYVADAKYKLTGDGYGRQADYYQLLAYCSSLGLDEGLLIYCQHDGSVPRQAITVRGDAGVRLRTVAIQLSGSPTELDERCSNLAEQIAARANQRRVHEHAHTVAQTA